MHLLHRFLWRFAPAIATVGTAFDIMLRQRGYWKALRAGKCVDATGQPIPWFTYPAIDFLSRFDLSSGDVLEYGAGQGSLWWAARARTVISVESDGAWLAALRPQAPSNLILLGPLEGSEYVQAPLREGKLFDIIVVDGVQRLECARAAIVALKPRGLLILDNSDRQREVAAWLRDQGFWQIDFHGFGPLNRYTWCTSAFQRGTGPLPYVDRGWPSELYGTLAPKSGL